jgi:hypothetical protein
LLAPRDADPALRAAVRAAARAHADTVAALLLDPGVASALYQRYDFPAFFELVAQELEAAERDRLYLRIRGHYTGGPYEVPAEVREGRRARLRGAEIAHGLLLRREPDARPIGVDSACLDLSPLGAHVLVVGRECTCGEPLACRARVVDDAIHVETFNNPGMILCTDCYPALSACRLEGRLADGPYELRINGQPAGGVTLGGGRPTCP